MKKFYSFVIMALCSAMSYAQGTMTEENSVLDEMGYRLEKDVNWYEGTLNGTPFYADGYEVGSGNDALSYTAYTPETKLNGWAINQCTNENMEWFYLQLTGNGIVCTPGVKGLASTKNERWIAMSGLRANQIIVIDISNSEATQFVTSSTACNGNTGWADTLTDPLQVFEITDSIHAIQELAEEGSADTFRYFQVNPESDGWLYAKFNGKSATNIWRMQIWSDKSDLEVVSAPGFGMKGVQDDARWIRIREGVSTFNSPIQTYYSTDGSEPLYLKETEEIESYEEVVDPETGDTTLVPVYKKVAEEFDGYFGDYLYDTSLGEEAYVSIDATMDEDGDGIVTLKARSITPDGVFSDLASIDVEIGAITLNAPSFTLVGMDGLDRNYQLAWDNNTLCGEEYTFVVEIDGDAYAGEYTVGDVLVAHESLSATVSAFGYTDGTASISVAEQGTEFASKGETAKWDFLNLTDEQKEKIDNAYIIRAYCPVYVGEDTIPSDTIWYSREEYLLGETEAGEAIPDAAEPVYGWFGWDGLDSRQTGRHWMTLLTDSTVVVGSEQQDSTVYTFQYAEDETGLFHDGFTYSATYGGTYPSCYSSIAIFTNDAEDTSVNHGIYNNTNHATIVVPDVQYGEYVVYTTSTGSVCEPAQATWDAETQTTSYGYTKDVGKNIYLWSVEVFTTENLPDVIKSPTDSKASLAGRTFNLAGQQVGQDYKGIVIQNGKKYLR